MDSTDNYKAAYLRQKNAREHLENILEDRSRELYNANKSLRQAYEKLKDQKAQLLHQEKLASIGQLSAGVAHEINNPTGYVKSNLSSLKYYMEKLKEVIVHYQEFVNFVSQNNPGESVTERISALQAYTEEADLEFIVEDVDNLVEASIDGALKITEIVQGLKTFSRIDSKDAEVVDINQCLEGTLKLVAHDLKDKANITTEFGELPATYGFPGNLNQVFLNLLVNAGQAMPSFGEICVSSKVVENNIVVTVADNGSGIEEEVLNKIFDPFFTTKDVGSGTGLGLSISHGIIKKHGGSIEVDSKVGTGTIFTITLPVKTENDLKH